MSDTETDSDDNEFQQDIQALRRACSIKKTHDVIPPKKSASSDDDKSDYDDDMVLLRDIKKRFSVPNNNKKDEEEDVVMKPLNTILPNDCDIIDDDDYGGDLETLRAIQRRFSQYDDSTSNGMESSVQRSEKQVGATNIIDLGKESSPNFFVTRINNRQGFPDSEDGRAANNHISSNITSAANVGEGHEPGSELVPVGDCGFPASAQAFVEAIKKNRTYQKFLRDKLIQVEARLEENKKLRERVEFLKGFQVACRKKTGRALSHKKDPRFQLISVPKPRANASKIKDTSTHPINQGPAPNPQVAIYKEAMLKYPFSLSREPWSKADKENLKKGIKQQIQEMMMQNLFSAEDPDSSNLDRVITRIKKLEITPDKIRSFLPKVNWEQLASMYLPGRSGPECESRWRNCEDPLINHGQWTNTEEKKMLHCFSNRGFSNWIEIAKELKTNRTPYQCLSRFQRSLNPSILNNEWTPTEDEELRKAVAEYGETNWQLIASILSGRTGTQCSNRWKKSLNPLRERVGKWDSDEDKRLKMAVRLFGAKNWNKITKFVPGRTQVQCRERWVNCLDPSLNMAKWTEEEDMKLKAAVEEHNYSWARVAACIPQRTDSQCRRRWMVLLPHQVPMLKAAKEIEKRCFVSNFVDREGERPQLTYKDFNKPLLLESGPKANEDNIISKDKRRRTVGKDGPGRAKKVAHTGKARKLVDEDDVENNDGQADIRSNGDGENCEVEKEATRKSKSKGKERSLGKGRPRRARKVTHTGKARKLVDEDDVEDNDGQADITSNGEGHNTCDGVNREVKKVATGKRKSQRKERSILEVRSRRARQVTHTAEGSKLNGDVTSHGKLTRQSLRNKANTSLKDTGLLEQDNGERIRQFDGDNCEIKKKPTRKRKQRVNDEHEEMDENCEPGPISKKKSTKESVVCGLASRDTAECKAILTNERSKHDSFSVRRSSRVPLMIKDVPSRDERCFSQVILRSMSGDGPQAKTLKKCKVSCKLPNGTNETLTRGRKRNTDIKISIRKREAVDGSGEMVLKDEETFANFSSKLKKRSVDGSGGFGEIVLEDEETIANFSSKLKKKSVDGSGGFGEIVLEDEETIANFSSKLKKKSVDGSRGFGEMVLEDEETIANFSSKLRKRRLDHLEK